MNSKNEERRTEMLSLRVRKSVMDKFRNICKRERLSQADCFEAFVSSQAHLVHEKEFSIHCGE